jgi:hypothetical protein
MPILSPDNQASFRVADCISTINQNKFKSRYIFAPQSFRGCKFLKNEVKTGSQLINSIRNACFFRNFGCQESIFCAKNKNTDRLYKHDRYRNWGDAETFQLLAESVFMIFELKKLLIIRLIYLPEYGGYFPLNMMYLIDNKCN